MKKILFFLLAGSLSIETAYSQTATWTGAVGPSWSDAGNWSTNLVPGSAYDVIIPQGSTVVIPAANVQSIQVTGAATITISGIVSITEASSFHEDTVTTWSTGSITGGGTLTNNGTMILTTNGHKNISGTTTLVNNGIINIASDGDLRMNGGLSVLTNSASGVIDMQVDEGNITFNSGIGTVNNAGIIKRTASSGSAMISAILNNSGTLHAQSGTLSINNSTTSFDGGTYNVDSGATLRLVQGVSASGILTGDVDGNLVLEGQISVAGQVALNFVGTQPIQWFSGGFTGGGTVTNSSVVDLTGDSNKYISGSTTMVNNGTFNITTAGDLSLNGAATVFNNTASGVVDMRADDGNISFSSGTGIINNAGIIKRTASAGTAVISAILNNTGTLSAQSGTLSINTNASFTGGTYNVSPGATLRWLQVIAAAGNLAGQIDGNLVWEAQISAPGQASFSFVGSEPVQWSSGSLTGGGTITNNSSVNLVSVGNKSISGATTVVNNGSFNITTAGDLVLSGGASVLDNTALGMIDMRTDDGDISFNSGIGTLNNAGLIRRSNSSGTAAITAKLNNAGTLDVQSGILSVNNSASTFMAGIYNVSAGAKMRWMSVITATGTLTGQIDGDVDWEGQISVPSAQTASFNFTGSSPLRWVGGSLVGSGTLVNNGAIDLVTSATKGISGSTLTNSGTITFVSDGDLSMSNSTLNNMESGMLDLAIDAGNIVFSGSASHVLNNSGLLLRSGSAGTAAIAITVNNDGTLDVTSGTLQMSGSLNNNSNGTIMGTGTLVLPAAANYTNNGTYAPGGSPGVLTVIGNQESTPSSRIFVELNGLTTATQYDRLDITGNASMDGEVMVALDFAPALDDEFTIAVTTGTISSCDLDPVTEAEFGNYMYTFDVACEDNNKVVLRVTGETLSTQDQTHGNTISLFPNPAGNSITLRNTGSEGLREAALFDLGGRKIQTFPLENMGSETLLNLERLGPGVYLVRVASNRESIVKRIIKR